MSDFYRRLDEKEQENRMARLKAMFEARPLPFEYQGCKKGENMTEPLQPIAVPKAQEKQEPNSTEAILAERGKVYGSFAGHACVTQSLKRVFLEHMQRHNVEGFKKFMSNPAAFEGMEMIFHKFGRIANGDPLYKDTWDDIAGYAKLVANDLEF